MTLGRLMLSACLTRCRMAMANRNSNDFGSVFSALGYLDRLPMDKLKIDCLFVIEMASGLEGPALVSNIISLAH